MQKERNGKGIDNLKSRLHYKCVADTQSLVEYCKHILFLMSDETDQRIKLEYNAYDEINNKYVMSKYEFNGIFSMFLYSLHLQKQHELPGASPPS